MCEHEKKYCPRCRLAFECKPGNITQCQCFPIVLSNNEMEYINTIYQDCLCATCIRIVQSEFQNQRYNQVRMAR